jgi:hypothetical protein
VLKAQNDGHCEKHKMRSSVKSTGMANVNNKNGWFEEWHVAMTQHMEDPWRMLACYYM